MQAVNCVYGVGAEKVIISPKNITFVNCQAISCLTGYLLNDIDTLDMSSCSTRRDDTEFLGRVNALDRIFDFDAATGTASYPPIDGNLANGLLAVGDLIELDNGLQRTIATIGTRVHPVFGNMHTFTTTPALTQDCYRRSFNRHVEVNTTRATILIGGNQNRIHGCSFRQDTDVIQSSGDHTALFWKGNFVSGAARYFTQVTGGTVTGKVAIESSDCNNVGSWHNPNKFAPAFSVVRNYNFKGGNTTDTKTTHGVAIEGGVIGAATCVINGSTISTTGTPTLKLNNTDIIIGGFSGNPSRSSTTLATPMEVNTAATLQLTDTVGDIAVTGYSVQLKGAFK